MVEPADGDGAVVFDFVFEHDGRSIGDEAGVEAEGAEGVDLCSCGSGVAVMAADSVVFVVGADFAVVTGQHGTAT